jgi:hypothetical protein
MLASARCHARQAGVPFLEPSLSNAYKSRAPPPHLFFSANTQLPCRLCYSPRKVTGELPFSYTYLQIGSASIVPRPHPSPLCRPLPPTAVRAPPPRHICRRLVLMGAHALATTKRSRRLPLVVLTPWAGHLAAGGAGSTGPPPWGCQGRAGRAPGEEAVPGGQARPRPKRAARPSGARPGGRIHPTAGLNTFSIFNFYLI